MCFFFWDGLRSDTCWVDGMERNVGPDKKRKEKKAVEPESKASDAPCKPKQVRPE